MKVIFDWILRSLTVQSKINFCLGDVAQTSDYDDPYPTNKPNIDDMIDTSTEPPNNVKTVIDVEDSNLASNSRTKDTADEDAQIREFFSMVCEICSDKFETFIKAKNHYRIVHNTVGYLTCCGKKFLRRGRVLDHIHRHLNPDAYRCDPCGRSFADKFALKNHIENHEPFDSRAFKCNLCSSSFTKASKLAQHERSRHCSDGEKKFQCDKCSKK